MIPLIFTNPKAYNRIRLGDRVTVEDVEHYKLSPSKQTPTRTVNLDREK